MFRRSIHIVLLTLISGIGGTVMAQQSGFYVPNAGKIFFVGDSASIFSDVINQGSLGVGKKATVNFHAKTWENGAAASMPDDANNGTSTSGIGGWVRFISDTSRQRILGGYNAASKSGPSFPHVMIENKQGVELNSESAKVRNQVDFRNGKFYLHDQILTVGNGDPGAITGYDSARYFVTGNRAGDGLLLREQLRRNNGVVVFPVGTSSVSYSPAAIRSRRRQEADYYVSVFDGVKTHGTTGPDLQSESVNKTWQIGKRGSASPEESDIFLEHELKTEGDYFRNNRQFAYVSRLDTGGWDTGDPQMRPALGKLTTGPSLASHGDNSRTFNDLREQSHYYTKLTGNKAEKTRIWFNAYREATCRVRVYWSTNPEVNVQRFVVERRLSTETGYHPVDTLESKAINGQSFVKLDYEIFDGNCDQGVSFYRIRLIGYDSRVSYSEEVPVGPIVGVYTILLWPNPTPDQFFIGIPNTVMVKTIAVYDVLGQKLREVETNGRTLISMRGLLPGNYYINFISTTNKIIETKKLLVQ